ncbi:hypothetical protein D3C75_841070 [compost metagenome]
MEANFLTSYLNGINDKVMIERQLQICKIPNSLNRNTKQRCHMQGIIFILHYANIVFFDRKTKYFVITISFLFKLPEVFHIRIIQYLLQIILPFIPDISVWKKAHYGQYYCEDTRSIIKFAIRCRSFHIKEHNRNNK